LPKIADVKVTPLVTGFAADARSRRDMAESRERLERSFPLAGKAVDAAARGFRWLEGPVDRYGLAFYLSGKATFLATMWGSAYFVRQGVDVQGILAGWGIDEGYGEAAGTIAGAATVNAFLTPLHFLAVAYGVKGIEWEAKRMAESPDLIQYVEMYRKGAREGRAEREAERKEQGGNDYKNDDREDRGKEEEEEEEEPVKEFLENRAVKAIGMLLLFYSLSVSLYAIRKLKETAEGKDKKEKKEAKGEEHGKNESVGENGGGRLEGLVGRLLGKS